MPAKAVVIGCAKYELPGVTSLKFPERDAGELYRRLVDPAIGGYAESNVDLLTSPMFGEASRALARAFKSASRQDSVLIYFAGHGLRDDEGNIYLAVRDTDPDLLEVTSMASRPFRQLIDSCRSQQICVILDCCFSGAFASRTVPSVADVTQSVTALTGEGTVILTATQRTQEARERDELGHGVFTNYLLQGIDGAADADGDGIITALDLYNFIARKMENLAGVQRPMFSGSLAGGVFPLVRSGRRRADAIAKLRVEVEALRRDKRHLHAEQLVKQFTVSDLAEERQMAILRDEIDEEKRSLREGLRRQLLQAAERSHLSDGTLREALDILATNPDAVFVTKSSDLHHRLLRSYLAGRLDAVTLEETWTPPEPATPTGVPLRSVTGVQAPTVTPPNQLLGGQPQNLHSAAEPGASEDNGQLEAAGSTPLRRRGASTMVRILMWSAAALALIAGALTFTSGPALDTTELRLGVLLKREWDQHTAEGVFSLVVQQLNRRLQGIAAFNSKIVTFTNIDEVSRALNERTVDVVGELSPRDIYVVRDLAEPFAAGLYEGLQHYNALIFVPAESPYLVAEDGTGEVKEASWNNVLAALNDGSGKLAVSDESSTSGFWFPRSLVLEEFRQRQWFRSFADVTVRSPSQELMVAVACGKQKVVAGVTAAFRLPPGKQVSCDGRQVTLVSIQKSEGILHGAYAVRNDLAEDERVVRSLKNSWGNAVGGLPEPQRLSLGLPMSWTPVNPAYYEPIRRVFAAQDPLEAKQLRDQKVALTAASLILIACAGAYYFLSTRKNSAPGR
jgi:ABC-type phosphate/phosphonate transport system substrate-binding protein